MGFEVTQASSTALEGHSIQGAAGIGDGVVAVGAVSCQVKSICVVEESTMMVASGMPAGVPIRS